MKSIFVCLFLCACGTSSASTSSKVAYPVSHPQYSDLEVQCAQSTIVKIYDRADHLGHEYFTPVKPSDAWSYYLGCILQENNK